MIKNTHVIKGDMSLILMGGGAHNKAYQQLLQTYVTPKLYLAHDLGLATDYIEAQAFGYLAVRSFYGDAISFPTTTGVKTPLTGGVLYGA